MSQAISTFSRAARHSARASISPKSRIWPGRSLALRPGAQYLRKFSSLILQQEIRVPKPRFHLPASVGTVRHCSHRRKMYFGNQDVEASVDITKGREVLPTNVKPIHYDLILEPNFEKFTYEGTVTIEYVSLSLATPLIRGSYWWISEADHRWNVVWRSKGKRSQ